MKAYGIYNELENEENEETYIFLKSRVLLNLGELYKNTHEFEKANKSFKDCNNIRRKLNKKNSDIYSKPFGNSLYCYAELLHINNFIEDTIEIINEALDIYFKLYYKNPYSFYINIGQCLIKKAEVCSIVNQISEAKSLLAQAIEIVKNHKDIDECLDLIIQSESLLEELNNN